MVLDIIPIGYGNIVLARLLAEISEHMQYIKNNVWLNSFKQTRDGKTDFSNCLL